MYKTTALHNFDKYQSHDDARCYSCGGPLENKHDDGYAPGRGQYVGGCGCPGIWTRLTWYDIAPTRDEQL